MKSKMKTHMPWHNRLAELRSEGFTALGCAERQDRYQTEAKPTSLVVCMYCGKAAGEGDHAVCHNRMEQFAADLRATPEKEKWKVFQAAENGHYGSVRKG